MKQLKMYTLLLMSFIYLSAGCSAVDPEAYKFDISVKVVDENSDPVEGANVRITFHHTYIQETIEDKTFHYKSKKTDANGLVQISSISSNRLHFKIEHNNYWDSFGGYDYWEVNKDAEIVGIDPSHIHKEFTIKLKRKENPRSLYVKQENFIPIPKTSSPVGYDFEIGDWVTPYGKGIVSDFLIESEKQKLDNRAFEGRLKLTFSNPSDGIIPVLKADGDNFTSELLLGRNAPLTGYEKEYKQIKGYYQVNDKYVYKNDPETSELQKIEGYWFRVRSKVNLETGEIIEARYGKIQKYINFSVSTKGDSMGISFKYYFSPDEVNSLEFNGESLIPDANLQGMYRK
ncbi:hypothetical protein P3T73_17915 [Kiritimatiellota bacterium B12222]|nr:hypothetical protein P3T73_17915 [Kiritimatiellota bacterium B12222]